MALTEYARAGRPVQAGTFANADRDYRDSEQARDRRELRRGVSRLPLSRNDQAVLQYLVNLWFVHRHASQEIHPGRDMIARKTGLSVRTIIRALAKFRTEGFIEPIAYGNGGRNSTRYSVSFDAILRYGNAVESTPGTLVLLSSSGPKPCATEAKKADKPSQNGSRLYKKALHCIPAKKKTGTVIKPSAFSMWQGTARTALRSWAEENPREDPIQNEVLLFVAGYLCPDDGVSDLSDRAISRETGLSRRAASKALTSLVGDSILRIDRQSRMRREIRVAVSELFDTAPGMPF